MKNNLGVCVFAGSRLGNSTRTQIAAKELGKILAERSIRLIYGGGCHGLMGLLANGALDNGGYVLGVVPRSYGPDADIHPRLSEVRLVETIEERKSTFRELSFAFIALPGGVGTLDEIADSLNRERSTSPTKPCGLLDVEGYYQHLIDHISWAQKCGMITADHKPLIWNEDPALLVDELVSLVQCYPQS